MLAGQLPPATAALSGTNKATITAIDMKSDDLRMSTSFSSFCYSIKKSIGSV
jgi:hypothetical protein